MKEEQKKQGFEDFWNTLEEGYDLSALGICAIITKVNAKSILTEGGGRWTKKELSMAM